MSELRRRAWSLEERPWRTLRELISSADLQWKRTILAAGHAIDVPMRSGVYAIDFPAPVQLCDEDSAGIPKIRAPIYIGRSSTSLRARFIQHTGPIAQDLILAACRWRSPQGLPRVFIWAEVGNGELLIELESCLIECFGPPCNKIGGARLGQGCPAGADFQTAELRRLDT